MGGSPGYLYRKMECMSQMLHVWDPFTNVFSKDSCLTVSRVGAAENIAWVF